VTSYQCGNCGYFDLEDKSTTKAIVETFRIPPIYTDECGILMCSKTTGQ